MILNFSFLPEVFEIENMDDSSIVNFIKKHGVKASWNTCDYLNNEILVSNQIIIPNCPYGGKVFYNIMFYEKSHNVFVERLNKDNFPQHIDGISDDGIKLWNDFNKDPKVLNRPSAYEIFENPDSKKNLVFGFCVDKIEFYQILEINVMYFNGKTNEIIKGVY